MYNDYINGIPSDVYHRVYGDGMTTGISHSYETNEKFKEEEKMSITYTQIAKDGIIMLSDSRCLLFENNTCKHNDNYKKIHFSKKYVMLISQVGENIFSDSDFANYINDCENCTKNRDELIELIKNKFTTSNDKKYMNIVARGQSNINLFFGYYDSSLGYTPIPVLKIIDIANNANNETIKKQDIKQQNCIRDGKFVAGVEWIQKLLLDRNNNPGNSAMQEMQEIEAIMSDAIALNNKYFANSSVGGNVQKAILRPDGNVQFF